MSQSEQLEAIIPIQHVIKGASRVGAELTFEPQGGGPRFGTPALSLDELVWSRREPGPAFDVPVAEILDVLVATGDHLREDPDGIMAEALDGLVRTSALDHGVLCRAYERLWSAFDRQTLEFQVERELGGTEILDGWCSTTTRSGRAFRVRAFPPRLLHVLAGNAPVVAATSIARGALTKGVHLLKLPSNDLFTASAILRAMAVVAPEHPTVRSFSAAYWRGGDERVESVLFRPQFFDKVVAWGGERAIRGALRYIGPGLELIAFDPKSSVSFVGHEALVSDDALAEAARQAAIDTTLFNQDACNSSRFIFLEGTADDADRFCDALLPELGVDRETASAVGPPASAALRDEVEALRSMTPLYRVWGRFDGRGVVVRSEDPVDFFPEAKVVNVVAVSALRDAIAYVSVATQTVGVYPPTRKIEVRDALASAGVQRIVALGSAGVVEAGMPHDGFLPLHRFMRWINDEG